MMHYWPRIVALLVVVLFVGGLIYLGSRIPPNEGGGDG